MFADHLRVICRRPLGESPIVSRGWSSRGAGPNIGATDLSDATPAAEQREPLACGRRLGRPGRFWTARRCLEAEGESAGAATTASRSCDVIRPGAIPPVGTPAVTTSSGEHASSRTSVDLRATTIRPPRWEGRTQPTGRRRVLPIRVRWAQEEGALERSVGMERQSQVTRAHTYTIRTRTQVKRKWQY